jgi:hypothetical protein
MKLDAYLHAHAFLQLERPPQLWEIALDDEQGHLLVRLLGEMIALGVVHGCSLEALLLNVSHVVVEEARETGPPEGEFVALTLYGTGAWGPERSWHLPLQEEAEVPGELATLLAAASAISAPYLYTRDLGNGGAVTVFLRRHEARRGGGDSP